MEIKTLQAHYELIEFHHYISNEEDKIINVLELLIKTNEIEYLEEELSNLFAIETHGHSHVFSNYEVSECYEVSDGIVRVICVK